jgi:hypothetical protein
MRIFDRIRLQDLDRRDTQLWALAIIMILILAAGLALHMYTLTVGPSILITPLPMQKGILAFCALALLFVGYLIDRQVVIARLRQELAEERKLNLDRRTRGNKELLHTLFGPDQFSDRLALELQRAADRQLPLSGLTIALEVSANLSDKDEVYSAFGEAVKAMMNRLRAEDSIYQFTSGVFGVILPGAGEANARRAAVRVADGLSEAMGTDRRYSFDIRVTSYPEHAKTSTEMERLMQAPSAR